jgi:hypothetical protein
MASLMCVVFSLRVGIDVDIMCCWCSCNVVSNIPLFYVYSARIVNMINMATVLDKEGLGWHSALLVGGYRDRSRSLGIFSMASDSSMCPGVDSASKNEYQGVKTAGA